MIGCFNIEKNIKGEIDYPALGLNIQRFSEENGLISKPSGLARTKTPLPKESAFSKSASGVREQDGARGPKESAFSKSGSASGIRESNDSVKVRDLSKKKLIQRLNDQLDLKTPAQVKNTFEAYDKNEDSYLNFTEFKGMV